MITEYMLCNSRSYVGYFRNKKRQQYLVDDAIIKMHHTALDNTSVNETDYLEALQAILHHVPHIAPHELNPKQNLEK